MIAECAKKDFYPVLDIIDDLMIKGAVIKRRDETWVLKDGTKDICTGKTIKKLLINLIFIQC